MAVVASSTPSAEGEPCFICPYAVSIALPKGDTPATLFDFNKESVLEASLEDFPITVTLQPSGPRLFLNSLRVWPRDAGKSFIPETELWSGSQRRGV